MSIADRFMTYAEAFEESFADDDWSRLEQYFTEDAVYEGDPEDARGRDAVIAKMKDGVNSMDRLMDTRKLNFETPTADGDTVRTEIRGIMTKAGLPNIEFTVFEFATFEGDRIARLRDEFDSDSAKKMGEWMAAHGAKLTGG